VCPHNIHISNLVDFYVRGVFEGEANQCSHSIKVWLQATAVTVMANIHQNPLICTCSHFQCRVTAALGAEGGWIG